MSFSAKVKEELSKINIFGKVDVVKAELYGYLMTVDQSGKKIVFLTENEYNINRLNKLLKKLEINYTIKMKGKSYQIEFSRNNFNLEKIDPAENEDTMKAFVRGAFLGSGWVTEPDTRYHLEVRLKEEKRKGQANRSFK